MSVSQHLHIKAGVWFASHCHKVVNHRFKKKSCYQETFGQHQGPASSAFEDAKRQTNYWQYWISQVALKCSVSLTVCSQMKQQCIEQFWHVVNYEKERDLIRIMHLLSLCFSHIIVILLIEIFMYQAQGSGVYVHVNLISQRLWNLWHERGIRPQAVSVLLRYMNHKKKAVYCISVFLVRQMCLDFLDKQMQELCDSWECTIYLL